MEGMLTRSGVSYRKTRRAERVSGFNQAPGFVNPDEFSSQVVIEPQITGDDGTARDKMTHVQHLVELNQNGIPRRARSRFEVIACIGGCGFKVRRENMKKLLLATRGKVFALENRNWQVECSRVRAFMTRCYASWPLGYERPISSRASRG